MTITMMISKLSLETTPFSTANPVFSAKRDKPGKKQKPQWRGKQALVVTGKPNVKGTVGSPEPVLVPASASPRQLFVPLAPEHIGSLKLRGQECVDAFRSTVGAVLEQDDMRRVHVEPTEKLRRAILDFTSPSAPGGPGHVLVDATGLLPQIGHFGVTSFMKHLMKGPNGRPAGARVFFHNALHQHFDPDRVPREAFRAYERQLEDVPVALDLSYDGQVNDPRFAKVRAAEAMDQRLGRQYPANERFAIGWIGGVAPEEPRGIAIRRRTLDDTSPVLPLINHTDGAEIRGTLFARFFVADNSAYEHGNAPKTSMSTDTLTHPPIVANPYVGHYMLRNQAEQVSVTAGILSQVADTGGPIGPEAIAAGYFQATPLERGKQALVVEA